MAEHLVFANCPGWVKEEVRSYWAKKGQRFDRLLETYRHDLRHFHLVVRRSKHHWEVRIVLTLPTGTLVADMAGTHWAEVLDGAADRLAAEIRRHTARIRHDDVYRRKRHHAAHFWVTAS